MWWRRERSTEDEPTPEATEGDTAFVRGFEVEAFEEWDSWDRLRKLLSAGQGAYGISGPRGAGKTWLMRRATEYAGERGGIGLWFPSPSEYESTAFLAALTEQFAEAVEEVRQNRYPVVGFATLGPEFAGAGTFVSAVIGAFYGYQLSQGGTTPILLGALTGVAVFLVYFGFLRVLRASNAGGRALLYARDVKQRVRFALVRREGVDLGAGGKGLVATLGLSKQTELTERPVTLSSLVHDFRRLAALAASASNGPIVIGIDELDKIDDDEEVRKLLRDIKGIFGVENVHYLVSVSHEAARALNLNGIVERNEFNSSFDVVLELDRIPVPVLSGLLIGRGWEERRLGAAEAIAMLSGGIPREAVRLAEIVGAHKGFGDLVNARVVSEAVAPEAREFRRVVVTAGPDGNGTRVGQEARTKTFSALSDSFLDAPSLGANGVSFVERTWSPSWDTDGAWVVRFQEEWRRLLVRIYAAAVLIGQGKVDAEGIQRAVYISTQSAQVAMLSLLETLNAVPEKREFLA